MPDTSSAAKRTLTVEIDQKVVRDLTLCSVTYTVSSGAQTRMVDAGKSRLNDFLLGALSVARANFPRLSEDQWIEILNAEVFRAGQNAFRMDVLDAWVRGHADDPNAGPAARTLASLSSAERLSVGLVIHQAWRPLRGDLRDVLSAAAHLPRECVLAGDAAVSELWTIAEVRTAAESIFVHLIFNGEVKAICRFERSGDQLTLASFEISHDGYFSPADVALSTFLGDLALPAAQARCKEPRVVS